MQGNHGALSWAAFQALLVLWSRSSCTSWESALWPWCVSMCVHPMRCVEPQAMHAYRGLSLGLPWEHTGFTQWAGACPAMPHMHMSLLLGRRPDFHTYDIVVSSLWRDIEASTASHSHVWAGCRKIHGSRRRNVRNLVDGSTLRISRSIIISAARRATMGRLWRRPSSSVVCAPGWASQRWGGALAMASGPKRARGVIELVRGGLAEAAFSV